MFLFTDSQIKLESFVEDINNLLNKISINAEMKEINNFHEYKISEQFIDQTMPITPSERIESWLEDNVITFGSANKLIINGLQSG